MLKVISIAVGISICVHALVPVSSFYQFRHVSNRGQRIRVNAAKYIDKNGEPIKAALSAYMHFCADERERVTKDLKAELGTEFKPTLVLSKLGELWRSLPPDRISYYQNIATKDKERYDQQLDANGISRAGTKKKSNRPQSGYMLFCAENREEVTTRLKRSMGSDFKYTEVMRELGSLWQQLDPVKKQSFQDKAAAQKLS
uniref:HMG box domain-containing protein n=1 Tax=Aureoumbra lagunensis TaxID=44058 RepID=A0A7S3NPP7_9STRA|mmetsp:Transcript_6029/g.8886  ORF Transcript_6029/g.8886 Transcript_6029/m.8886 type:complete len:200 (+) Transcript_6029:56-655(+)